MRPRRRWYALPAGILLGSLGVGSLVFWLVIRPLEHGEGTPLRILAAFVVLVIVVAAGFLTSFVAALVIAVRRSRARREALADLDG
ncbi:MAG: hypothetical protein GEV10_19905 [Streptosporangiales bacterium]|nr:hypothetical protein [Streptosporangiales bacterium]